MKSLDTLLTEYASKGWTVRTRGDYQIGRTHYVGAQIEDLTTPGTAEVLVLVPTYRHDHVTHGSAGPVPPAKPLKGWINAVLFDGLGSGWYASGWSPADNVLWLRPSHKDIPSWTQRPRDLRGPVERLRVRG